MDNLKPVMKYYFWGLFVIALIIPLFGWWSGASGYVTQITEQKSKIEQAYTNVPASASNKPNPSWLGDLNKLIPDQEKRNKESAEFLWEQQKKNFFWPGPLQSHLPVKYRGEFAPIACDLYRNEYRSQRNYVWQSCDPVDPSSGKGTVYLNPTLIPNRSWPLIPPVTKEIWDAQEDLWLLKSLMDVIKEMNSSSSSVNESPLRMVKTLVLTGGDGTKVPTGVYAVAAVEGEGAVPSNDYTNNNNSQSGSFNVTFPFESELGAGGDARGGSGEGDYSAPSDAGDGGTGTTATPGLRYVGAQEGDVLSLQRGFYMEVVIDHRKIQDFIVKLTNCSFPIKINKYQFGIRNNLNPLSPRKLAAPNPFARRGAPTTGFIEIAKTSSDSALSASYLANLAICGQMAIFTPPPHLPEATGEIPVDPNAPPATATTPSTEAPGTNAPAESAPIGQDDNAEAVEKPNEAKMKPETNSSETDNSVKDVNQPETPIKSDTQKEQPANSPELAPGGS